MSNTAGKIALEGERICVHFSDFFNLSPDVLDQYGAFNVSLINDLPLFVDPFLLFNSKVPEYRALHDEIIKYVKFLRDLSVAGKVDEGLLRSLFCFPEVKQNWFGFTLSGNDGSGLGIDFAKALHRNLRTIFANFGEESITRGSHLEKLCLIKTGIGRDNFSDFTTNLIKEFLLNYTQNFAQKYLPRESRQRFAVNKVRFNYETESWESDYFDLPHLEGDFVLLTPRDILTKDETWINSGDYVNRFTDIADALPDGELRSQVNNYLLKVLPEEPKKKELTELFTKFAEEHPEILDHYIRHKEDTGERAVEASREKIHLAESIFIDEISWIANILRTDTDFYEVSGSSIEEARKRVAWLKHVIEEQDGYKILYHEGKPIAKEAHIQLMFKLCWCGSPFDFNAEVNNGRGPVDFKVSKGAFDKAIIEFKLASNKKLRQGLEKQVDVYKKANRTEAALKVIFYFNEQELSKVNEILQDLGIAGHPSIILIDAGKKVSASNA